MRWLILAGLIFCAGGAWAHGPGGGAPDSGYRAIGLNEPTDTDGDGDPDSLVLAGDYNDDGALTPEDIQLGADALTDAGPKTLVVEGGVYSMGTLTWPDWNTTGFVEIDVDDFALVCHGTTIQGFTTNAAYASESNTANIQITGSRVTVKGCKIDNPIFQQPYDRTGWSSEVHWAIFANEAPGVVIEDNEIVGSQYTAIDVRESDDAKVVGNRLYKVGSFMDAGDDETTLSNAEAADSILVEVPNGEGANYSAGVAIVIELDDGSFHFADVMAVATGGDPDVLTIRPPMPAAASSGNYIFPVDTSEQSHGITIYTQDGTPMRRVRVIDNAIDGSADTAWHVRVAAGTDAIRDVVFANNHGSRTVGRCFDVAGVRGGKWVNNTCDRTQGVGWSDDGDGTVQDCFATVPEADCSDETLVKGNAFTRGRYIDPSVVNGTVRFGRGHTNARFVGNHVNGTIEGNCVAFLGAGVGFEFDDNTIENCGGYGVRDGAAAAAPGVTFLTPTVFRNNTIRNVGRVNIEATNIYGLRWDAAHQDVTWRGLNISGCVGPCLFGSSANSQRNITYQNYTFDGTRSGFLGRFTDAQAALITPSVHLDQTFVVVTDAADTSDCTFGAGTGSTQNLCMIEDTDGDGDFEWKDYGSPYPTNHVTQISNTGTVTDISFLDGRVMNASVSSSGLYLLGAGTLTKPTVKGLSCSNTGAGLRSTDAMAECLKLDSTTITNALVSDIHCGTNITLCTGAGLTANEAGASSVVQSTNAITVTGGADCTTGALWQDIDTTGSEFNVCSNSEWVDLLP